MINLKFYQPACKWNYFHNYELYIPTARNELVARRRLIIPSIPCFKNNWNYNRKIFLTQLDVFFFWKKKTIYWICNGKCCGTPPFYMIICKNLLGGEEYNFNKKHRWDGVLFVTENKKVVQCLWSFLRTKIAIAQRKKKAMIDKYLIHLLHVTDN